MTLGKRIRELRQKRGWSLAQLAKRSGVALSSLSRMETAKMTGTLESHIEIAKALGIRLTELYAALEPAPPLELRTAEETSDRFRVERGATWVALSKSGLQNKMLPTLLTLGPRSGARRERGPAGSEKFVYLIKGEMEVLVGSETVLLNAGDSLYFQASSSHTLTNAGAHPAVALVVTSPPQI